MVMTTLYRGSVGGEVPVGPRARERGNRSHDHAGRVAAPQEIVAQTRRRALAGCAEQGGQPAAAGLEAALGLGDLDEGGLDGQTCHGARDGLRVQLPGLARRARAAASRRHQPFLKMPGRVTEGAPTNPAFEESQVISPVEKMPLTLRSKSSGLVAASRAVSYVTSSSR